MFHKSMRRFGPQMAERAWFEIRAAKNDTTEILIYDEISMFGVSAKDFVTALRDVKTPNIRLRINSPGGDVFDGIAIYNALRAHPAKKTVHIDGLAASIASVIAMAGDEIVMADSAFMMIHDSWGMAIGNADELRALANTLEQIDGTIADIYRARTGKKADELRAMMDAETWMTASQAVDLKFAHRSEDAAEAKNAARFDLSGFKHPPTVEPEPQAPEPPKANTELMKRRLALAERGLSMAR
jgi:ATP-dependent protease ClpP protease subunit